MTAFLRTVRKSDGDQRFYVGGCRVSRGTFAALGTGPLNCLQTIDKGSHWHHRHERPL